MSLKDFKRIDANLDRSIYSTNSRLSKSYDGALVDLRSFYNELYNLYGDGDLLPYYNLSKYNRLTHTKAEIDAISRSLYSDIVRDIDDDLKSVYVYTYDETMGVLSYESGVTVRGNVKIETLEKAYKTPVAGLTIDLRLEQYEQDIARRIYQQMVIGSSQGYTPRQFSDSMKLVFKKNNSYIRRIVETESHRMQEQAKLDTMDRAESQGLDVYKTWISSRDSHVRASHRILDGTTIKKDELFTSPSGARGLSPGNMGSSDDDINCRCYLNITTKKDK